MMKRAKTYDESERAQRDGEKMLRVLCRPRECKNATSAEERCSDARDVARCRDDPPRDDARRRKSSRATCPRCRCREHSAKQRKRVRGTFKPTTARRKSLYA